MARKPTYEELEQRVKELAKKFILIQKTELGPRGFPLTGLAEIPEELREIVITIITTPPVSHFLKIIVYSPNLTEAIPITYVEKPSTTAFSL